MILDEVLTVAEAAKLWGISASAIKQAISQNRFSNSEVKKSCGTWLICRGAMVKLYGAAEEAITVFTIGYEGKDIDSFIDILTINNIHTIFDVRAVPVSRKKGFSKASLEKTLSTHDIGYYNFKELGSPKDIREALYRTKDYETFFCDYRRYLNKQPEYIEIIQTAIADNKDKNFCLMCYEHNSQECHRSIIANELVKAHSKSARIINL